MIKLNSGVFMICQYCNHQNFVLSFYCEECGCLLSDEKAVKFDSDINRLKKTVDENIYEYNGIFIIIYVFKDVLINFGEFLSYDDALIKKNELSDDGWPIPTNFITKEEVISKNILKKDDCFFVFNEIDGKRKIYGKYKTKKDATLAKYKLIENNWNNSSKKTLPNYITETRNGTFFIQRRVYGEDIRFGTFETLDDAIFVKSLLESKNWKVSNFSKEDCIYENDGIFYIIKPTDRGKLKIQGKYQSKEYAEVYSQIDVDYAINGRAQSKYGEYIYKTPNNLYVIRRTIDGVIKNFGYYGSLKIAQYVKKLLVEHNWNANYFIDNNIFEFGEKFLVLLLLHDNIELIGEFYSYDDAQYFLEGMDKEAMFQEAERNIYKKNNTFFIQKLIHDNKYFTVNAHSFDNAISIKDFFEKNNWNLEILDDLDNILHVDDRYFVFHQNDSSIYLVGEFDSYESAFNAKSDLLEEYANHPKIFKYHYGDDYIRKTSRGFSVFNYINGNFKIFGTFKTRKEAIERRNELIKNNWHDDELIISKLSIDDLNEIIFKLSPWQKIVFDNINKLNSEKFTFEDLMQFKSTFRRYAPNKVEEKVIKNLDDLMELGLLIKLDDGKYQKLWDY